MKDDLLELMEIVEKLALVVDKNTDNLISLTKKVGEIEEKLNNVARKLRLS